MYSVFSRLYDREPDSAFLAYLASDSWTDLLQIDVSKCFADSLNFDEEYTGLFLGPGKHFPLQASAWMEDGTLVGEVSLRCQNAIRMAGLDLTDAGGGFPDRLPVLFELMHRLIEAEKADDQNAEKSSGLKVYQAEVFHKLLDPWVLTFLGKVAEVAELSLYRTMSELCIEFMEEEREFLKAWRR